MDLVLLAMEKPPLPERHVKAVLNCVENMVMMNSYLQSPTHAYPNLNENENSRIRIIMNEISKVIKLLTFVLEALSVCGADRLDLFLKHDKMVY